MSIGVRLEVGSSCRPVNLATSNFRSVHLRLATTARLPTPSYPNTATMVSTLVPPKVRCSSDLFAKHADIRYRSLLPTYVLLSPLPFSSDPPNESPNAHPRLRQTDRTRIAENAFEWKRRWNADRHVCRPLAAPLMPRACRGLSLSTRSSLVALPLLPSPRASSRDTSTVT
jgi:hypothetical protein